MTFIRQTAFDVEYSPAKITKWRSARTGLQATYVNQPSPVVHGYFAVATEIANDSGCPHTLEHLVFMGSQKYPYKGLLDSLSNRFFSSTNAWTSVDQTVYTLSTAGWEGFKTLLPVYLDHCFHPTITDEACMTEVYHVDGKGKEKGVVFSELQGIEAQAWFIAYLALQKTLYARGSGYAAETGGVMAELRKLAWDEIRAFHRAMYRPDNMCIVVTGSVDEAELLQILERFDRALAPLPAAPRPRPFVDSPPDLPLAHTVVKRVEFPDDDASMGELVIGWIGPACGDTVANLAVDMVGSYLTDSAVSLLNKHLVELSEPLATDVCYATDDFVRTGLNFTVSGVPTAHLDAVDAKIKHILADQCRVSSFDLAYMRQVVAQQRLKHVAHTEKDATSFSNTVILEFLYGNTDGSDLPRWCKDLRDFDTLLAWSADQWCSVVRQYFVDNKSATILAVPSPRLNKQMKAENKSRTAAIKQKYGKDGLRQLQERLDAAQAKNDRPIPEDIVTQFGKPDSAKIDFIKTDSYRAGRNDGSFANYKQSGPVHDAIARDKTVPMFLHFEDYESQFATVHLLMSTATVPKHLLRYLSVIEEIFSLSIQLPSGEYIPFNEVITRINNDLIDYQFDNGIDNSFVELSSVKITFETAKYRTAIQWLIDVLKYSVFEEARVKVIIEKYISGLADKKRSDELMLYSLQYRTLYTDGSTRKAQDFIHTEEFYHDLHRKMDNGEFASIKADLEQLRSCLLRTSNIATLVMGGCSKLEAPVSAWETFAAEFDSDAPQAPLTFDTMPRACDFLSPVAVECSKKAFVVTLPAGESSHFTSMTPIPTDYLDEDIFKIALASEFLGGVEGPFWRAIRGTGLAYGANIRRFIESGYLAYTIYRASDAVQCWVTGKKIISDFASGETAIDDVAIENAIAAIVNELANAQSNFYEAGLNKIMDTLFKKRGDDYLKHFLEKLNTYTKDDVVYVLKKYFLPLFTPTESISFSCIPAANFEDYSKFLETQGCEVTAEHVNAADLGSDSESGSESGSESESASGSDESEESESDSGSDMETES